MNGKWGAWGSAALLLLLAAAGGDGIGWAAAPVDVKSPAAFTHRVSSSHVELYWNCSRPEPGLVRMEGLAFNPGSNQPIRWLALELAGVTERGRTLSEGRTELAEPRLATAQSAPFALELRPAGGEARFDLYYSYVYQDNGGSGQFLSRVSTAAPFQLAQTNRFLVRDACSASQHLNR